MMKNRIFVTVGLLVLMTFAGPVFAAFVVEPHSSGLASDHFYHNGPTAPSPSTAGTAPGLTATNSVFGGSAVDPAKDTYVYSVTVHGYFEGIEQRTQYQNTHFRLNAL